MECCETPNWAKILQNLLKECKMNESIKDKNILTNKEKQEHG